MFFFLRKSVFAYFTLVFLVIAGGYATFIIGKESLPELTASVVSVQTSYPGASATDVEDLVTNVLEGQLLTTLSSVESITSSSALGQSNITVNFLTSVNIRDGFQAVKDAVEVVSGDLPNDANDPVVTKGGGSSQPVFVVSVSTRSALTQLSETVKTIQETLESVPGVSTVNVSGLPERQVNVIAQTAQLDRFGLNTTDVANALAQADGQAPVGSIVQSGVEYSVRFDGSLDSIAAINNSVVGRTAAGEPIYARDIARVEDGLAVRDSASRLSVAGSEPQQAITFSVTKQAGYNVTTLTADLQAKLAELETQLAAEQLEFYTISDRGQAVLEDLTGLSITAVQTVALVFVVLLLGLGLRQAFVAALAIPVSFLLSFIALYYIGMTLNVISLFALVLVVGMLVDSAVVMVEGMSKDLSKGRSGRAAARYAIANYAAPVIAGGITTIAIFVPMLFLPGRIGDFIFSIPATVVTVLAVSLFVALAYIPLVGASVLRPSEIKPGTYAVTRERLVTAVTEWYRLKLRSILTRLKVARLFMAGVVVAFAAAVGLLAYGVVPVTFFPPEYVDEFAITVTMPPGSILSQTEAATTPVEEVLRAHEEVASFVSDSTAEVTNITVLVKNKKRGEATLTEIRDSLATLSSPADIFVEPPGISVSEGAPFVVKFVGKNIDEMTRLAEEATALVKTIPGTVDVTNSLSGGGTTIVLEAHREALEEAGLTVDELSNTIRAALFGTTAYSYTHPKSSAKVDVVVKAGVNSETFVSDNTNAVTIDTLLNLPVATKNGNLLLGSLVSEQIVANSPTIEHEGGKRIVTVSSYLRSDVLLSDVNTAYTEKAAQALNVPTGIQMQLGGETETSSSAITNLLVALLVGIFLITVVLVFQFNSIRLMGFIASVIPLGMIGVLFGLALFGQSFSFTAMLGFVALVGIVINNSIILIDAMIKQKATGEQTHLAVVLEGATSRLRPILLTTATTVVGMVPLLFVSPRWSPLALAVIFGLLFAAVLTLVMIPVLYYWWGKERR